MRTTTTDAPNVPVDVSRLRELARAVTFGPDLMSITFALSDPPEPLRDADLVIGGAAKELDHLRAEVITLNEVLTSTLAMLGRYIEATAEAQTDYEVLSDRHTKIRQAWGNYKLAYEVNDPNDRLARGQAWDRLNRLTDMKSRYSVSDEVSV